MAVGGGPTADMAGGGRSQRLAPTKLGRDGGDWQSGGATGFLSFFSIQSICCWQHFVSSPTQIVYQNRRST